MSNKKLLDKAAELGLEPVEGESDEDLAARINEAQNSEDAKKEFDPTTADAADGKSREELVAEGKCPDCAGQGIRNPDVDHQVCQTCQGTGKA